MHAQVGAHSVQASDRAVFLIAAVTLLGKLLEVRLRRLVSDSDIDLVLGQNEIADLVVTGFVEPQLLQVVLGINVVDIVPIEQEVLRRNIARKESPVTKLYLRGLINKRKRARH